VHTWDDDESQQSAKMRKRDLEKKQAEKTERMFTERYEVKEKTKIKGV
jgi:hypothetical protein